MEQIIYSPLSLGHFPPCFQPDHTLEYHPGFCKIQLLNSRRCFPLGYFLLQLVVLYSLRILPCHQILVSLNDWLFSRPALDPIPCPLLQALFRLDLLMALFSENATKFPKSNDVTGNDENH